MLAGILLFLCLLSGLRSRLRRAEGPEGGLTTLATAAGPACAGLWVAAIAAFTAVSAAVEDESQFTAALHPHDGTGGRHVRPGAARRGPVAAAGPA